MPQVLDSAAPAARSHDASAAKLDGTTTRLRRARWKKRGWPTKLPANTP